MAKDKLQTLADQLEETMHMIETIKGDAAVSLEPLEKKEEEIRANLQGGLIKKGYAMIRTTSGLVLVLVKGRVSYKVKKGMETKALEWAIKEFPSIISLSAAKLSSVVQPMLNPPEFVERIEGQPHLSVKTNEE